MSAAATARRLRRWRPLRIQTTGNSDIAESTVRILWWQEAFWPRGGGLAVVAQSVLRGLRACGDEVIVVTAHDSTRLPRETDWEGISVRRFPFWQALSAGRIDDVVGLRREIESLRRAFAPDLVHMSGFGPSALFHLESARSAPIPLLLSLHSSNTLCGATNGLARQALEDAAWVTACSRSLLDAARAEVPTIAGRSSVVYNGVDAPALAPAPPPLRPLLLCVGDLASHKGFDLAVRALPILLRRFPDLRLVVAGDGPARDELCRLAVHAGVSAAVDLIGVVQHANVPRLMNAATVIAVPSRRESFSLVALEAALMARPVVAARVGGLPEVVVHGRTGMLVEPDNPAALADAIETLLASPATAARLGNEARQRARGEFSVRRQVDAYRYRHRQIAAGGRDAGAAAARQHGAERACE